MKAKKMRFIHKAIMMTAVTFVLRGIGTAFGIYLSNQLGAEGIGLYQLASSIYFLAVTLSTSGITVAVTRIVSEQLAVNNYRAAKDALYKCLFIGITLGFISAVMLFFGADFVAKNLLRDERVIKPLMILAFSLPFLSSAAILRGYFMGARKESKAAGGDIAEQVIMIVLTLAFLPISINKGLEAACCALVFASTLAEACSCVYAFFLYATEKKPNDGKKDSHVISKIFSIAAPVAFSNYIRSALTSLENLLTPSGLGRYYDSKSVGLSQYGMIKGMVMPVLFFPSAVLSALSGMLVPEVSAANAINNKKRINFIINKCFQITLLFSFFIAGLFLCFHEETALLLYKSNAVGKMILYMTPLIPLLYLDQVVDSILKGLNQQVSAMKYNTADAIMRTLLVIALVPMFGTNGYIAMFYIGTIFNASMSIARLLKVGKIKFQMRKWLVMPLICVFIAFFMVMLMSACPISYRIIAFIITYLLLLMLFSCVKKSDFAFAYHIFFK